MTVLISTHVSRVEGSAEALCHADDGPLRIGNVSCPHTLLGETVLVGVGDRATPARVLDVRPAQQGGGDGGPSSDGFWEM